MCGLLLHIVYTFFVLRNIIALTKWSTIRIVFNKTTSFYWTKQQYFNFQRVGSENSDTKKIRNDKRSHLVLKLFSTSSHTRSKSISPLSICFINYALVQVVHSSAIWRQFVDNINACLVNPFLQYASDLVVAGLVQIGAVGWPQILVEWNMVSRLLIIRHS